MAYDPKYTDSSGDSYVKFQIETFLSLSQMTDAILCGLQYKIENPEYKPYEDFGTDVPSHHLEMIRDYSKTKLANIVKDKVLQEGEGRLWVYASRDEWGQFTQDQREQAQKIVADIFGFETK